MSMYLPPHFTPAHAEQLHAALRDYPFATLVTHAATGIEANHLPLVADIHEGKVVLRGHLARANPVWRGHEEQSEVLAIFHGPQHYVTPSWYPGKREHGKAVPTWNYLAIHARGQMRVIDDAGWLRRLLETLTAQHEAAFDEPWHLADAPADYLEKMLGAVVGIEIEVSSLQGKYKFSQNQPAENRAGVVAGLRQIDSDQARQTADWVAALAPPDDAH
jgi:transcriptional regulator